MNFSRKVIYLGARSLRRAHTSIFLLRGNLPEIVPGIHSLPRKLSLSPLAHLPPYTRRETLTPGKFPNGAFPSAGKPCTVIAR